jgi:hypothetical protein
MMRLSRLMVRGATTVVVSVAAVALGIPSVSAASSAGAGRHVSLASEALLDDEAALRPALRALVDAGATGAVGFVDDGEDKWQSGKPGWAVGRDCA